MKKLFPILIPLVFFFAISCQTRMVSQQKPLQNNTLELYQKYTFQTLDAEVIKMEVLKVDETTIFGKNSKGESIEIERNNVREVKQLNILHSVAVALAAVAALIFIPI